jgi:hypothetical protein
VLISTCLRKMLTRYHHDRAVFEKLSSIWRFLIPDPQDRIPVTLYTIHNVLFPLVPLLFMGYLVRRPNTHIYRLALMPFTIWTILRASFGYVWVNEEFSPYNFGQGELEDADFIITCGRCNWLGAFIGSLVSFLYDCRIPGACHD